MFVPTTSLTRIPVENRISMSAVSRMERFLFAGARATSLRGDWRSSFTVPRATVRGRTVPTLTSLRKPGSGFFSGFRNVQEWKTLT